MNIMKRINDSDFVEGKVSYMDNVTRYSSRGILFNDEHQIAMMYMTKKGCYKLPGGGIELNETKEQAFLREVLEETGCKAEIVRELGIIEEHKMKNNFMQLSYCFVSKVISEHDINLTEHEVSLGFKLCWLNLEEALKEMNKSIESCKDYSMNFMLLRDKTILTSINNNDYI